MAKGEYNPKSPDDFNQEPLPDPPQDPLNIIPAPFGSIMDEGSMQSPNFRHGQSGWKIDSDGSAEFNEGVSASELNIPDETSVNSFHVDVNGNAWWGANVAVGYAGASAVILNSGQATFKSIQIGGANIQYTVGDSGIFSFGDGSDGAGVADGSTALAGATLAGSTYTLTRDVYYTSLTISTGVIIKPAGYRIFGTGTLTMNGTANINGNGSDGGLGGNGNGAGVGGTAGAAGAALADGYLKGSLAGVAGGAGANGNTGATNNGGNGTNTLNSIGVNPSAAVAGGFGGTSGTFGGGGNSGSGGTGGSITASNVKLIANWHLATLLDVASSGSTVKFDNSASAAGAGGGGGGGGPNGGGGGGGGGSGSSGRIVAIYFRNIVIGASASITANGGNGGGGGSGQNGRAGNDGGGGGGGGGTGGSGGQVILVYNTLTNSGSITAAGGTKGTGGAKGLKSGSGTDGNVGPDGNDGAAGTIRQFQVSL